MSKENAATSVLDEIVNFNQSRKPKLVRIKYERMNANPFGFFRGTDHLFAWHWPAFKPADVGPSVLSGGDLHLENFGAYAADDGEYFFDINDFDEALVAPCSLDLVRCTTSILLASDLWQLTPIQAAAIALVFLDHYRLAITKAIETRTIGEVSSGSGAGPIWDLLGETALADQKKLLDRLTRVKKSGERQILRDPSKFPKAGKKKVEAIRKAVERYGRKKKAVKAYEVLDVTGRIAGTGSLGLRRYTVLIAGGGEPDTNRLIDIKEAAPSALLSCTDGRQPASGNSEAHRVVNAQRQLQARPTRGLDVLAVEKRWYRMREMVPDENRSRLDRLHHEPGKLREAVAVAGELTAWSQLRGCKVAGEDRTAELVRWTTGPALDGVLAAAVRCADRTIQDYQVFHRAYAEGRIEAKG